MTRGWLSIGDGHVLHTADGGRTWCQIQPPFGTPPGPGHSGYLDSLFFATAKDGVAIGFPPGVLRITNDGGVTWRTVPVDGLVRAVFFLNQQNGCVATSTGLFKARWQISP